MRSCGGDFSFAQKPLQAFDHSRGLKSNRLVAGQLHEPVTCDVTRVLGSEGPRTWFNALLSPS